jgi:2-oxoglutarate ferredoxin oxidoreductase subunit beta
VRETKKAIERAFLTQEKKKGFSLVEVLSTCPTYWHMTPEESMRHVDTEMTKAFPLGVFRDWE